MATDRPLMRALFFDHPGDAAVWEHPQQWMLGDDLLVSPVTEAGAQEWPTWLPPGEWVDVWTGEGRTVGAGGEVVTRAVPLDEVPVWCRASAWPRLAPVFAR